ncbi:DUF982 domain-containing protein [Ensifer sp. NPDC090286]|uniref:DUF982 domain-containing protein n=1 Tax=unclassified Ensifer TaxID=2633371 RepID=UPI00177F5D1A|nr:DUF982 domain-containing protein [Ensifer sp. ENS09]MBD9650191.1 DUF982 domain-containing protein [Ensifer sp. ENS09]
MYGRELPWGVPLSVRLQSGAERLFSTVFDALDFLENEWPVRNGQTYKAAVDSCREALNGRAPASVAREAFVGACIEAGMTPTPVGVFSSSPSRLARL